MSTVEPADTERLRRLSITATRAFLESGLRGMDAEVVVALDVSRTMAPMYLSGSIQHLVESLLALALGFDDDGVVPMWTFGGEDSRQVGKLDREEFAGWVARNVDHAPHQLTGACHYAPLVRGVTRRYFPIEASRPIAEKKVGGALKRTVREYPALIDRRPFPIFVIVVTGGECADPTDTIQEIRRASHLPIFFQFAGISPAGIPAPEFAFLHRLDRLTDRWVDNCGFFAPRDFTDPGELFHGLLNEFPGYLRLPRVEAMLIPPPEESAVALRPPTAVTMAIPDDVDDSDVLVGPTAEDIARREREREERQRRRRMLAQLEAAQHPTDRGAQRPPVHHRDPPPMSPAARGLPPRPPSDRPATIPPRPPESHPPSEPAHRAPHFVPAPAPPSVRATKPPSGRTPRRVLAPPPNVTREPSRPPRHTPPPPDPGRTPRRGSVPAAPAQAGARIQVRPAPPPRETPERASRRVPEPLPAPRVENPTPRPTPRTPPPVLPPDEPTLRSERPTPSPRPRPEPRRDELTRHEPRRDERTRDEPRRASPDLRRDPPQREPARDDALPAASQAPAPPAAPPQAPPPADEDPAIRLARIRARRAARRAARDDDDDPTMQ